MAERGAKEQHLIQSRVSKTVTFFLCFPLFAECARLALYDDLLDDFSASNLKFFLKQMKLSTNLTHKNSAIGLMCCWRSEHLEMRI